MLQEMPGFEAKDVVEKLDEVSRNLRLIEHGGSYFEISTANNDANSGEIMLHISTYSSSISTNPGNAWEFASHALLYPDYKHVYVASFGNGGSSPLIATDGERRYFAHTGRLTKERNGQTEPLESIKNLQRALEKNGLAATRIMGTDSAGGSYATALALDMEPGQLSHAFLSERSGFVHLSKLQIIRGMLYQEGVRNSATNKELTPDLGAMSDDKKEFAKTALANHVSLETRQELADHMVKLPQQLWSMWVSMQALRRGPTRRGNPAVADTNPFLARHPNAHITYGMAEEDPLYKNAEQCRQAAADFLGKVSVQAADVRVTLVPAMTHAYNTYMPQLYYAVEAEAFGR